jgi:hypothetical protein
MHMAGGGMHRGGRGDARASCASPLGTPLLNAHMILDFTLERLVEEKNKYKDWLAFSKTLTNTKDWSESLCHW